MCGTFDDDTIGHQADRFFDGNVDLWPLSLEDELRGWGSPLWTPTSRSMKEWSGELILKMPNVACRRSKGQ